MAAYQKVYEEKTGHAAGDSDAEKQASQLASDVRYKAKSKVPEGASEEEKKKIFLQILNASPAPNVVKAMAKQKLLGEEVVKEMRFDDGKEGKEKRKEAARGDVEKALKACYGIPSAGNSWGRRLRSVLENQLGMKRSVIENSLYYKRTSHKFDIDGDWLIACTITDDIPYNGDRASKDWFRESMSKVFRITHEPTFTGLVGIEVKWDDVERSMELTQTALINKIADNFDHWIGNFAPLNPRCQKISIRHHQKKSLTKNSRRSKTFHSLVMCAVWGMWQSGQNQNFYTLGRTSVHT